LLYSLITDSSYTRIERRAGKLKGAGFSTK
jgi:hypothetical protein